MYVGSRLHDQVSLFPYNEVPPGIYPDLQAAKPYPAFGEINVLENRGSANDNGLQIKWERRFAHGLSFSGSYSLAKNTSDTVAEDEAGRIQPFTPAGYQSGRAPNDRRHMVWINAVYELPFGRDRPFLNSLHPVLDAILGGWQLSGIDSFVSGVPLSINVPGATLGNGWGTRANVSGDPDAADPSVDQWFNTSAFSAPPALQYGNSALGIIEGPGAHILDLGLMKSFSLGARRYIQVRAEAVQRAEPREPGKSGYHAWHRELRAHPERRGRAHDAIWPEALVLGMATGQIYMLLGLLSFSMLGVLHKVADVQHSRPATINGLLASSSLLFVFAFVMLGPPGGPAAPVAWPVLPFRSA